MHETRFLLMAGGRGTRLWPKSRHDFPKQFIDITGDQSLLQSSYRRLRQIASYEDIFVVTLRDFAETVMDQLPDLPRTNMILEPSSKNTAACIAMSLPYVSSEGCDATIVTLPVDAYIENPGSFLECLRASTQQVQSVDGPVVIGIQPTRPDTGFGYIRVLNGGQENSLYRVAEFIEKPDLQSAETFYRDPAYYWNSGIVVAKNSTLRELIKEHLPNHALTVEELVPWIGTTRENEIKENLYNKLESISIDCGVLEKTSQLYMMAGNFQWDDLGTWNAIGRLLENVSANGNVFLSPGEAIDVENCIIDAGQRLTVTIGVKNLIVVCHDDVLLICDRNREEEIRILRSKLAQRGHDDLY